LVSSYDWNSSRSHSPPAGICISVSETDRDMAWSISPTRRTACAIKSAAGEWFVCLHGTATSPSSAMRQLTDRWPEYSHRSAVPLGSILGHYAQSRPTKPLFIYQFLFTALPPFLHPANGPSLFLPTLLFHVRKTCVWAGFLLRSGFIFLLPEWFSSSLDFRFCFSDFTFSYYYLFLAFSYFLQMHAHFWNIKNIFICTFFSFSIFSWWLHFNILIRKIYLRDINFDMYELFS
jgi:hypothetical protein